MAYMYRDAEKLAGLPIVGTGECVEIPKTFAKAPATPGWKEGSVVKGAARLTAGTAIATFVGGHFPQHGKTGKHAGLYLRQDAAGIWVVDQWSSSVRIQKRRLRFKGKDKAGHYVDPSNNGDAFSVIE